MGEGPALEVGDDPLPDEGDQNGLSVGGSALDQRQSDDMKAMLITPRECSSVAL